MVDMNALITYTLAVFAAIRLGAKTFIPMDRFKESVLTIGLGYTYVPMISKISSWDISLGYTWTF